MNQLATREEALSPAQDKAMQLIRTRGVYGDAQGRGIVDGSDRRIRRQTIRSLFDRGLVKWSELESGRIVPK